MNRITGLFRRRKQEEDDSFFLADSVVDKSEIDLTLPDKSRKSETKYINTPSAGPRPPITLPPKTRPSPTSSPRGLRKKVVTKLMPVLPRVGKKIGKAHELAIDADRASKAAGEFRQVQKYPPAFSQMFPGVDSEIEEEKIEESATKQWYYKDDLGVEQGPFTAATILDWIEACQFDGRGNIMFRRGLSHGIPKLSLEDRSGFHPLLKVLPYIARAEAGTALSHLVKSLTAPLHIESLEEKKQIQFKKYTEFDIPLDLTKLELTRTIDGGLTSLVPPDVEIIILPPRIDITQEDVMNLLGIESEYGGLSYCQLESDDDWLQQTHSSFSSWAKENAVSMAEKVLLIPAHSIILKSASPVLFHALEAQEKEKRRREIQFVRTVQEQEDYVLNVKRLQLLIRATYPEAFRLLIRRLYGHKAEFLTVEPVLLACIRHESQRLGIVSIANEACIVLARVKSLDEIVALTEIAEILEAWDLFEEFSGLLSDNAFFVLSGKRYLRLGPLGFRKLLSSDKTSLDEIQLFVAAHLWLVKRQQSGKLNNEDFWEAFRRQPKEGPLKFVTDTDTKNITAKINPIYYESKLMKDSPISRAEDEMRQRKKEEKESSNHLFSNQVFIFSAIRFDQMSPSQLREVRIALRLDSLLVHGLLRKLLGTQLKRRLVPWRVGTQIGTPNLMATHGIVEWAWENSYFITKFDQSGFPIRLIRENDSSVKYEGQSGTVRRRRGNRYDENTQIQEGGKSIPIPLSHRIQSTPDGSSWAWSSGDARPIAEASWAVEILKTKNGKISIGLTAAETGGLIPNISIPVPSNGCVVWYFNLKSREFYTGMLINDFRVVHFRLSMTPSGSRTWTRDPMKGDVIALRVSVGISNIRLNIQLFGHNGFECGATTDIGHHIPQRYRGIVSNRPVIMIRPWFELHDLNDSLTISELHLNDQFFLESKK